jgi:hypothetical protein
MEQGPADLLGVLGFALALVLGFVKFWETFFRRSKFAAFMEWGSEGGAPALKP